MIIDNIVGQNITAVEKQDTLRSELKNFCELVSGQCEDLIYCITIPTVTRLLDTFIQILVEGFKANYSMYIIFSPFLTTSTGGKFMDRKG